MVMVVATFADALNSGTTVVLNAPTRDASWRTFAERTITKGEPEPEGGDVCDLPDKRGNRKKKGKAFENRKYAFALIPYSPFHQEGHVESPSSSRVKKIRVNLAASL